VVLTAVGALSWSLVHLHNDYDDIQQQTTLTGQQVNLTRNIVGLLMRPDVERQAMVTSGMAAGATAYYMWTRDGKLGAIVCHGLPDPPEGKVYQVWLSYETGRVNGGTFTAWQEQCQHLVSLEGNRPAAVGVSVEPVGGSPSPSGEMVLSASLSPLQ
jgi:hypothetical protein